jgi:hypothetical protein
MNCVRALALLVILGTAGCQEKAGGPDNGAEQAPANASAEATPNDACGPVPELRLAVEFEDVERRFQPGSVPFVRTADNFRAAFDRSCREGLFKSRKLVVPGPDQETALMLRNAPDANVASIYEDEPDASDAGHTILEYAFVNGSGAVAIPTADELAEAMFCHVQGPSPEEQTQSGRCLPD